MHPLSLLLGPLGHRTIACIRLVELTLGFCGISQLTLEGLAYAQPVEIEVHGRLELDVSYERSPDGSTRLVGRMLDELGRPLSGSVSAKPPGRGLDLKLRPCDTALEGSFDVRTSPSGEFCAEVLGAPNLSELNVLAHAPYFEPTSRQTEITNLKELGAPSFVTAPAELHGRGHTAVVEILASAGQPPAPGATLRLSLTCKGELSVIGQEALAENRLLRFEFDTPDLPHGACRFVATSSAPGRSQVSQERDVLLVREARLSQLDQQPSSAGTTLRLSVDAADRPVEQGIVEAYDAEEFVGTAPVKQGTASIEIPATGSTQSLTIRFISNDPALLSGPALLLDIEAQNSQRNWAPWHAVGLLLFASWLCYAWLRPKPRPSPTDESPLPKKAQALQSGGRHGRVQGQVLDAHTGLALGGAHLILTRVEVDREVTLEEAISDGDGRFRFERQLSDKELLSISCSKSEYLSFDSKVVRAQLQIYLPTLRRAVIAQLVKWARRRGHPWDRRPAATVGHVQRVAVDRAQPETARWAEAVGEAAYGPLSPSQDLVERLKNEEPQA